MDFAMTRKVDELGRIVLPMDYRRHYGIKPTDAIDIIPTENGILLKKHESEECNKENKVGN